MWPPERWQPTGEKPRVVESISELIWVWALFTWPSLFQFPSHYNFLPQCLWFADLIFKWCSVAFPSLFMFFLFFHLYYCLKVLIHQLIFQLDTLSSLVSVHDWCLQLSFFYLLRISPQNFIMISLFFSFCVHSGVYPCPLFLYIQ